MLIKVNFQKLNKTKIENKSTINYIKSVKNFFFSFLFILFTILNRYIQKYKLNYKND